MGCFSSKSASSSASGTTAAPSLNVATAAGKKAAAGGNTIICAFVGSKFVGKTTLIRRLAGETVADVKAKPSDFTVKIDEQERTFQSDIGNNITFKVRDFAGTYEQQYGNNVPQQLLRGISVYVCCFSKADRKTFDEVLTHWVPKVKEWATASETNQGVMMVMCKSDTEEPQVTREEAIQLTKDVTAQLKPVRVRGPFLVSSYQEDTIMNLQQTLFSEHEMLSK